MRPFVAGAITGAAVVIAVPLLVLASGLVDMGAASGPLPGEEPLAELALDRSIAHHAPSETNPYAADAAARAVGLDHYREMCVDCHGAPGIEPEEFAQGLEPPAPRLWKSTGDMSDGEMFWIIKNGIRMTGMPAFGKTHSNDKIWKIVAFVRALEDLSPEERAALRHGEDHEHEAMGGHEAEEATEPDDTP